MIDNQGDRIEQIREKTGLTQREFAETIGIRQGSYNDVAKGRSGISSSVAIQLHEKYNVNLNWLLPPKPIGNMYVSNTKSTNYTILNESNISYKTKDANVSNLREQILLLKKTYSYSR